MISTHLARRLVAQRFHFLGTAYILVFVLVFIAFIFVFVLQLILGPLKVYSPSPLYRAFVCQKGRFL